MESDVIPPGNKIGSLRLISHINAVANWQCHMSVSRIQVSNHRGCVFLKFPADKLLVFNWSHRLNKGKLMGCFAPPTWSPSLFVSRSVHQHDRLDFNKTDSAFIVKWFSITPANRENLLKISTVEWLMIVYFVISLFKRSKWSFRLFHFTDWIKVMFLSGMQH